jgi:hypothetical protein
MKLLGTVEIKKEITDYVEHLKRELTHYSETASWVKYQNNIPVDVTEEVRVTFAELKRNYEIELERIKETVLLPYPAMTRFELGEGIAYVWGN